ncbi:hypothetical protein PITCH_A1470014 [uncultured Desulfobacterium sp.]|uniref:Uncharacterized protein n=1 Tax=uncultured Desulfobacterium sp. TaxID=201089 RepID=A0A445MT96_9BACT|nr:hypothetical protein PITCH_A1470014 [uncultured Desulfobacterium sp.]
MKIVWKIIIFSVSLSCLYGYGVCLDSEDIIRLKRAQVDDETLQLIVQERVIETCSLSVDDIVFLKKSGIANRTIRSIIESKSSVSSPDEIEYGEGINNIRSISVKDIVYLKDNGISDEVIQSIVSRSGDADDAQERKAWEMLENMGVVIDKREGYE